MAGLIVGELRSPFTVDRPPPRRAPSGCPVVIGWDLAAHVWYSHLPRPPSNGATCGQCCFPVPCPWWRFVDAFLADALKPHELDGSTSVADQHLHELPRVRTRPPLPHRQPSTFSEEGERYVRWFTR